LPYLSNRLCKLLSPKFLILRLPSYLSKIRKVGYFEWKRYNTFVHYSYVFRLCKENLCLLLVWNLHHKPNNYLAVAEKKCLVPELEDFLPSYHQTNNHPIKLK